MGHAHSSTQYVVLKDETLYEISLKLYGTTVKWPDIARWNHLNSAVAISAGQTLKLEEPPTLTPEEGHRLLVDYWRARLFGGDEFNGKQKKSEPVVILESKGKAGVLSEEPPPKEPELVNRKRGVMLGLGSTWLTHTETGIKEYTSHSLTAKIGYQQGIFSPKWTIGVLGFFTVLQLSKSSEASLRSVGLNLRIGYTLPQFQDPWSLSIYGGWYYASMFVTGVVKGNSFGFLNVAGPQLYPALKRFLKNGDFLGLYLKFSPISQKLSVFGLGNHEFASGLSYNHILKNTHLLSATLDYAKLYLDLPVAGAAPVVFDQHSLTVGVGYGF